ncbi:hypothetical protein [Chryseobacterium sp.]|uniref:hypothetical protein n=1 Tax=Chryseobacterium sp. TaxID=1871047 RepID=UPI0035B1AE51
MKTIITKLFLLLTLSVLLYSCSSGNHYHDGTYQTEMMFMRINYQIDGNEIIVDNSLTGISKLTCRQYPDRIEYTEDNGTTRVLTALENGDLKFSDMVILHKISEPKDSTTDTNFENKQEEHPTVKKSTIHKKESQGNNRNNIDFKREAEKQYKNHRNEILKGGVVIDSEDTFTNDLNSDGQNEIIKYYTLANKEGGCMYVGRGILVYENTKIGVLESIYEPSYAFEFTGIVNGKITVSKLDFSENDMCYPTIPTKGNLNFKNHQLYFE